MSWTYDAPSGVYKNHALSSKIREEAMYDTVFMRFVTPEPGFGKGKGESVTITKIANLALANRVSEMDELPRNRPAISTKAITVSEWGNAIPVTNLEKQLTHYDAQSRFQKVLRTNISETMDKMCADAFKLTPIRYAPTGVSTSSITTNSVFGATATANLGINHLREIRDYMRSTLKVPYFRNGKYVGILSTRAARGIKNDPEYKDWQAPTDKSPFISGMLKDVEGFMLIETNHVNALDDLAGASTVLGEAVFFGDDAVALAEVQTPELRAEPPRDFGRFVDVGWTGILEAGIVWDTASLARCMYVGSL